MPVIPPTTTADILALGKPDPTFTREFKESGFPNISEIPLDVIKQMNDLSIPSQKAALHASRPPTLTETDYHVHINLDYKAHVIVCRPTNQPPHSPLVILLHGGGYATGRPENEVPLARAIAQSHGATVVIPSYRLAPEFPYPTPIDDIVAVCEYIARESVAPHDPAAPLLPATTDARGAGFILAGESAGGRAASVVAHLFRDRDRKIVPRLTGLALFAAGCISESHVPSRFKDRYLSMDQCRDALMVDKAMIDMFEDAFRPDVTSSMYSSFLQHSQPAWTREFDVERIDVAAGHVGLPRTYFQVCGMDPLRDDSLIFEGVLRGECGIETRMDVYPGWPHCWWSMFPRLEMTTKRIRDAVDGVGWLLERK